MDIDALAKGVGLINSALTTLKQAIDLLPEGSKKDEVTDAARRAERELKLAEAETAKGLGYEICRNHFPPEIMLSEDDKVWKCPKCGNEKNTGLQKASFQVS